MAHWHGTLALEKAASSIQLSWHVMYKHLVGALCDITPLRLSVLFS